MAAGTDTQGAKTPGSGEEDLSMEEILQSIRRIIAEDDSEGKKGASADKPKAGVSEVIPGSDVLELTEMVKEDGTVVSLKSDEKPAEPPTIPVISPKDAAPADVLNKIDEALIPEKSTEMATAKPEEKPADKPAAAAPAAAQADIDAMFDAPAPAAAPTKPAVVEAAKPAPAEPAKPAPAGITNSLLSAEASTAAASAIKKLKNAEPELPPLVTTPSAHFRSGNTVEDMVADMLRPMMKSWLDDNLPQIVERIVEREVKKLTKYLTDKGE